MAVAIAFAAVAAVDVADDAWALGLKTKPCSLDASMYGESRSSFAETGQTYKGFCGSVGVQAKYKRAACGDVAVKVLYKRNGQPWQSGWRYAPSTAAIKDPGNLTGGRHRNGMTIARYGVTEFGT